jgi:RHS repeat-associated protein
MAQLLREREGKTTVGNHQTIKYRHMKKTFTFAIFSLLASSLLAQHEPIQPFEELGVKVKILTLSNGKYQETFSNDTIMRIGSVMYHRFTGEVVVVVEDDTLHGEYSLQPDAVSRWLSPDPLGAKYPEWSPYNFVYNNPLLFIDPDGQEGIVVSGQPGDHKNREHFLANGLNRATSLANKYNKAGNGEKVTWFIYNGGGEGGYDQKTIDSYKEKAAEAGINVQVVSDADDIVDYVNDKNGGDSRSEDLVSDFAYLGHATPGDLDIGYVSHDLLDEAFNETLDVSDFDPNAFSPTSNANVVGGCRTAIGTWYEDSVVDQLVDKVGGTVKGSNVRVYYPGGVVSDKNLVKKNKGEIVEKKGKGGKKD